MAVHVHIPTVRIGVAGAVVREVTCQRCSRLFRYRMVRRAEAWSIAAGGIEESVRQRAQRKLAAMLRDDHDPVACPYCTVVQNYMIIQSVEMGTGSLRSLNNAACIAVLVGLLFLLASSAQATNFFARRFTLGDDQELLVPGWTSLSLGVGLFAIYFAIWWQRKNRLQAVGGPRRAAMPRAYREEEALPELPSALIENAAMSGERLRVQLLDIRFPPQCVMCLKPTVETETITFKTRPVTVRFPMCAACQQAARRERIRWTVICAVLLGTMLSVPVLLDNGTLPLAGMGFGVGAFAGALFGWDLVAYFLRPIQFRDFSKLRNTAAIRFRNRSYRQVFIDAN